MEYSGALQIVPGSHKAGTPPPPGTVDPPGAIDVLVKPGTAVFFEYVCTYSPRGHLVCGLADAVAAAASRRTWHSRGSE